MARSYQKLTLVDLTETCEMIAWYLLGAKNKDICAAYSLSRQSFEYILNRYHVPRKASNEHREAIRRATINSWGFRSKRNGITASQASIPG